MEALTANYSEQQPRTATSEGKEYLVVPMTLIVPGVLAGSQGPLYYPPKEIANNYKKWNHTPIVVYHPTDFMGNPLSARGGPDVIESSGVGVVRNAYIDRQGKLKAEGWFDVERTKRVDPRILNSLLSNTPIELSTGLFTDNVPAPPGSTHNGRYYDYIARNYRPDHLAILPDQVGACSISDGCGVLVNCACDNCSNSTNQRTDAMRYNDDLLIAPKLFDLLANSAPTENGVHTRVQKSYPAFDRTARPGYPDNDVQTDEEMEEETQEENSRRLMINSQDALPHPNTMNQVISSTRAANRNRQRGATTNSQGQSGGGFTYPMID